MSLLYKPFLFPGVVDSLAAAKTAADAAAQAADDATEAAYEAADAADAAARSALAARISADAAAAAAAAVAESLGLFDFEDYDDLESIKADLDCATQAAGDSAEETFEAEDAAGIATLNAMASRIAAQALAAMATAKADELLLDYGSQTHVNSPRPTTEDRATDTKELKIPEDDNSGSRSS